MLLPLWAQSTGCATVPCLRARRAVSVCSLVADVLIESDTLLRPDRLRRRLVSIDANKARALGGAAGAFQGFSRGGLRAFRGRHSLCSTRDHYGMSVDNWHHDCARLMRLPLLTESSFPPPAEGACHCRAPPLARGRESATLPCDEWALHDVGDFGLDNATAASLDAAAAGQRRALLLPWTYNAWDTRLVREGWYGCLRANGHHALGVPLGVARARARGRPTASPPCFHCLGGGTIAVHGMKTLAGMRGVERALERLGGSGWGNSH